MEAPDTVLVTHTRTFTLARGGTVTVTVSGLDEDAAILQPEAALTFAEQLLGVAEALRGITHDPIHDVE